MNALGACVPGWAAMPAPGRARREACVHVSPDHPGAQPQGIPSDTRPRFHRDNGPWVPALGAPLFPTCLTNDRRMD